MAQQQQRYRVIEKIASGGMAEVFRAESAGLEGFKKTVAIKRVLPHLAEKKQFIGMFLDEARLSAHLSHSNCVQVFDIGVGDNTYFIVMEFVDGSDLKAVIEYRRRIGQPIPIEEACLICVRICEGLAYAHELSDSKGESLKIVHRDMSPPNVLITRHGEVKIVDFGLAKANSQLEHSEPGIIKGKSSYLSPEAAQGLPVDARTDIFAVGIILWELLAGQRLFLGESDLETVRMVQQARVPSVRKYNPRVTRELEDVLMRSLAGDPSARYSSARELGRDLNKLLFHLGREVSSFDISQLVLPIWRERLEKKRQKAAGPVGRGSIIGSLIDEALFEFTSIDGGDKKSQVSMVGAMPLSLGTFAQQNWMDDLGLSKAENPTPEPLEVGNLAALEDDPISAHSPSAPPHSSPPNASSAPPAGVSAPPPTGPSVPAPMDPSSDDDEAPFARKKTNPGLIVGVVFAILLILALVAYFAGAFRR
ncbi:MAG TPA: serine/threonine-protein kinase [Polyangiaceae bacterium]|nr:serine/threonine-protein kinase [Polyangiaceae bacterium]